MADSVNSLSWPVKMAQFVPPPSQETLEKALPYFRKKRSQKKGAWLSSSNMATVTLSSTCSKRQSISAPFIALFLNGHVHEEHFLSSLAFTWPRFIDKNGQSSPGRVVFASYKSVDTNIKHKFAMQFQTVLQAEWFFQTLQQLISQNVETSQSSQNSTQQAFSHSSSESSQEGLKASRMLNAKNITPALDLSIDGESGATTEIESGTTVNRNVESIVLPPRFPPAEVLSHSLGGRGEKNEITRGISRPTEPEDFYDGHTLKNQIMACLLDPGFEEFVNQVENAWQEMEKDIMD